MTSPGPMRHFRHPVRSGGPISRGGGPSGDRILSDYDHSRVVVDAGYLLILHIVAMAGLVWIVCGFHA